MAKLITKEAAVERDYIAAIRNYNDGVTIDFKGGEGAFLRGSTHYASIVRWWKSPCEVDMVLDKLPECCCDKCCKCCKSCCNNN